MYARSRSNADFAFGSHSGGFSRRFNVPPMQAIAGCLDDDRQRRRAAGRPRRAAPALGRGRPSRASCSTRSGPAVTPEGHGYDPQRGELWYAGETAEALLLELQHAAQGARRRGRGAWPHGRRRPSAAPSSARPRRPTPRRRSRPFRPPAPALRRPGACSHASRAVRSASTTCCAGPRGRGPRRPGRRRRDAHARLRELEERAPAAARRDPARLRALAALAVRLGAALETDAPRRFEPALMARADAGGARTQELAAKLRNLGALGVGAQPRPRRGGRAHVGARRRAGPDRGGGGRGPAAARGGRSRARRGRRPRGARRARRAPARAARGARARQSAREGGVRGREGAPRRARHAARRPRGQPRRAREARAPSWPRPSRRASPTPSRRSRATSTRSRRSSSPAARAGCA